MTCLRNSWGLDEVEPELICQQPNFQMKHSLPQAALKLKTKQNKMKTSNTLTEIILKMCSTCLSLLVETTGQNSALFGYLSHQYEGKYCASLV